MEMTQPKPSVVEQIKTGLKRRRPNHRIYFLIFAASILFASRYGSEW
jgi:hypothetical protein